MHTLAELWGQEGTPMAKARLTISSRNYSSWSLRGWLLCRLAGLAVEEEILPVDDPATRAWALLDQPAPQYHNT